MCVGSIATAPLLMLHRLGWGAALKLLLVAENKTYALLLLHGIPQIIIVTLSLARLVTQTSKPMPRNCSMASPDHHRHPLLGLPLKSFKNMF